MAKNRGENGKFTRAETDEEEKEFKNSTYIVEGTKNTKTEPETPKPEEKEKEKKVIRGEDVLKILRDKGMKI